MTEISGGQLPPDSPSSSGSAQGGGGLGGRAAGWGDAPAVPYGTPEAPRVAVRGEASLEFDPEYARIDVTVSARGTDRRTALEDLTRRNTRALELVRGYGDAVEKLSTGTFSVQPQLSDKSRRERVHAYHGRVRLNATVTDFTVLGELTSRLGDLELTQVEGPWWGLWRDSPAHREARQQAVREAVTRAREYAEAVGAGLVALVELADLGAENAAPQMPAAPGASFRGYGGPAGPPPELDLEPQRQTVRAQVNARFVMSVPRLD
ncbi:SIMPL domain-containing protein [Streptomyces reniochalinae]|uniref:SIMPL domain-containing protein n=1 Tax=Streptomyces reniochalinae TaxID=2250578 RepID=A0A367EEJ6_9ACTN|nr:SIMPL domain-containing protein [Streptomyces reniochalinae]RCG16488.1 SIMPL domain-containing protein [Streptomyces reniochalinae]